MEDRFKREAVESKKGFEDFNKRLAEFKAVLD